jgi:hypothetical protein
MLNAAIRDIPIPDRMKRRPVDSRGFPVPWFVAKVNGEWDFRVLHPGSIATAHKKHLCWLCGEPLGQYMAFVIGPMCSINRVSSEPPSHRECAEYAVRACPFLSKPRMVRNEKDMPQGGTIAGVGIMHNPGATLIWITKKYKLIRAFNGVLFEIGNPESVHWYKEGREATRAEIKDAINKGLPYLREMASIEGGEKELEAKITGAMKLLPAA